MKKVKCLLVANILSLKQELSALVLSVGSFLLIPCASLDTKIISLSFNKMAA